MSVRTTAGRVRARVVSIAMQKGGVGKSTTIVCCARAAAIRGLRVLVIDLDPQGNTTSALAADEVAADQLSIADAIAPDSPEPLAEVIVKTIWTDVDLAPALTDPLATMEDLIAVSKMGREQRLKEALEPILAAGTYDLVLIDNAPSLGLLLTNALTAADEVFGVMEADQWSCDGLAVLLRTVAVVIRYYNSRLGWSGMLISKWRNTGDEARWLDEIVENFTVAEVWVNDKIPLWSSIKTTLAAGQGLDESKEARLRVLAHSYRRIVARWVADEEVTV
jgi:chromosome partitioning protein